MLTRRHNETCGCCSTPNRPRVWLFGSYWHCTTCLHSIGVNAAGNHCTDAQYAAAWREIGGYATPADAPAVSG